VIALDLPGFGGSPMPDWKREAQPRQRLPAVFLAQLRPLPGAPTTGAALGADGNAGLRGPAFTDVLRATIRCDLRDRLDRITAPTMIVWGFDDRVIPVQASLSLHRRIPGSRLEIFERTGHVPQLERPARFNALLDDFLVTG
jgi:pimeloyl-ACP methyl ester carboxylesterase